MAGACMLSLPWVRVQSTDHRPQPSLGWTRADAAEDQVSLRFAEATISRKIVQWRATALRLQIVFSWPHQKERRFTGPAMADTADTANVIVRPPIAWALAVLAGRALNWLMPLPFLPAAVSAGWLGAIVFAPALALVAWAIATMTRAGSNVPTRLPTTTIVEIGPYRFTRNPIYLGMLLGLIGLAIATSLWLLIALVPFAFVIRYGVVAREEAYLER